MPLGVLGKGRSVNDIPANSLNSSPRGAAGQTKARGKFRERHIVDIIREKEGSIFGQKGVVFRVKNAPQIED